MSGDSSYKWRVAILGCCIGALNYADRAAIASVYPLVRADLSLTDVELAAVGSFFLFAYAFASPLTGILADRLSRRRIILWSLTGWSAMTLATGCVTTTHELLLTRVPLGLFEAAYVPAAIGLIAEHHSPLTRATAIGLHSGSLSIGVIAGGAVLATWASITAGGRAFFCSAVSVCCWPAPRGFSLARTPRPRPRATKPVAPRSPPTCRPSCASRAISLF